MTRIDLDDLPPRLARLLTDLKAGDELVLVQGGGVVQRLSIADATREASAEPPAEADMQEVLEHFRTMIEEEF
jgi:antitoxin (DNA-binding transcriptional repressor) of toxin-antitoxin stability system